MYLDAGQRPGWFRRWREDVTAVQDRDPAAGSNIDVTLTSPGLHALWLYRLAHGWWRQGHRSSARLLAYAARMLTGVEIHPAAQIGRRVVIDHGMGVVIGETAEVGDDVLLYHGVTLGGRTSAKGKRHPSIGSGVMIGAGARLLGPITVGDRTQIGANAVVVRDVPRDVVVAGVPGRVLGPSGPAIEDPAIYI
jgi:serine O-acetyltransferase